MTTTAYCLKCRRKRPMINASVKRTKKGGMRLTGKCSKCKMIMNKMISTSQRGKGLLDKAVKGYQRLFSDIKSRVKYGRSPFTGMTRQQFIRDSDSNTSWRRWSTKHSKIMNKSGRKEADKYRTWYFRQRARKMKQLGLRDPPGVEGDDD